MIEWISQFPVAIQALIGTLFTWGVTALGLATVFFFKTINKKIFDAMLGFAAGVMIAASFWSLLSPSIEMAEAQGITKWLPAVCGFLLGGGFLWFTDVTIPHLHPGMGHEEVEGPKSKLQD